MTHPTDDSIRAALHGLRTVVGRSGPFSAALDLIESAALREKPDAEPIGYLYYFQHRHGVEKVTFIAGPLKGDDYFEGTSNWGDGSAAYDTQNLTPSREVALYASPQPIAENGGAVALLLSLQREINGAGVSEETAHALDMFLQASQSAAPEGRSE